MARQILTSDLEVQVAVHAQADAQAQDDASLPWVDDDAEDADPGVDDAVL